jgi:hypothetical protein
MTSLEDAAATLRVVVPGYLAMRWFFLRAVNVKIGELELVLVSLVVSLPLYWIALLIVPETIGANGDVEATRTVIVAMLLAVLGGEAAAQIWWAVVKRWPQIRERFSRTVWDAVLGRPGGGWVQVTISSGTTYQGWLYSIADTAQTDDPDLYVMEAGYVGPAGELIELPGVEGVLIPRSSVVSVMRLRNLRDS